MIFKKAICRGPAACTTKQKKEVIFVSVSLCFQNIMCHHA